MSRFCNIASISSQPEGLIAAVRSAKVWGTVCFVGERSC
jgi:hypothetical protein